MNHGGLMVYDIWISWNNGLQRVHIMDKFVEPRLCMLMPVVRVDG